MSSIAETVGQRVENKIALHFGDGLADKRARPGSGRTRSAAADRVSGPGPVAQARSGTLRQGQGIRPDFIAIGEENGAVKGVLQFAYISGPAVTPKGREPVR